MKTALLLLAASQVAAKASLAAHTEESAVAPQFNEEQALKSINDMVLSGSSADEGLFANFRLQSSSLVDKRTMADKSSLEKVHMATAHLVNRDDIVKEKRSALTHKHQVVFAIKQKNMDQLEKALYDVSDHSSPNYGKHWTRAQVAALTANHESSSHVEKYLIANGVNIVSKTMNGEYITAEAPIARWEKIFATKFYQYSSVDNKAAKVIRANEFSLSKSLVDHLTYVYNVVDFPDRVKLSVNQLAPEKLSRRVKPEAEDGGVFIDGYVTPALLTEYYWIDSNTGSELASQAVYESINQTYSPSDLTYFQEQFNLPVEPVAIDIGGHEWNEACVADGGNNCGEANLDVQYLMGLANGIPTTYYYDDNWMLAFVKSVADMESPPLVISVSYGSPEPPEPSYTDSFNNEAMKLGVMGVTILASSGDDGVADSGARNKPLFCGYNPSFPASSPYVTAVGATQGPETGGPEIACTADVDQGVITTGGGFSNSYGAPSWQTNQIAAYFAGVAGTAQEPQAGYNTGGRGYPDISAMGARYVVVMNQNDTVLFGTSASAPVVAAMVSLVNSARLEAGKSALGWINPSLYSLSDSILLNDITSGENNCVAEATVCCAQGFYATPGWDPVSGLGTLNFTKFKDAFMALGNAPNTPTEAPSVAPGEPTNSPVRAPTVMPSFAPTAAPTATPGWVKYSVYQGEECADDVDIVSVTGVPTGTCFIQYDSDYNAVGSAIYSCGDMYATITQYTDLKCSTGKELDINNLFLGCNPEYENYYYATQTFSSSLECVAGSQGTLPLPTTGTYDIHTTYDDTEGCTVGSLSTFAAFLNGHCFTQFGIFSFEFNNLNTNIYLDTNCQELQLVQVLDQTCIINDDDAYIPLTEDIKRRSLSAISSSEHQDTSADADIKHHPDTVYYDYYGYQEFTTTRLYGVWSQDSNVPGVDDFYSDDPMEQISLPVNQDLVGITAEQYNSDMKTNNNVFATSVGNFLPDELSSSNVKILVVYDNAASSRRRLASGDVAYINYTIVFDTYNTSAEVADIEIALSNAIADGSFNTYMQATAKDQGSILVNASSTAVTFGVPVESDDDFLNNDDNNKGDDDDNDFFSNDTNIIIVACAAGGGLLLIAALAYYFCVHKKSGGLLDNQA